MRKNLFIVNIPPIEWRMGVNKRAITRTAQGDALNYLCRFKSYIRVTLA